ncbi:MAG: hypothetical protein APF76_10510 [Desulfitibacter sp. BRH_c19]|nr:MAG: hypothetical protein APF76_10510 [Desulfitibacter sp. BRH_c19]
MNNNNSLPQAYARPILGILIKDTHANKLLKKQEPPLKYLEVIKANEQAKITIYFFSSGNLDENVINGIIFNKNSGNWEIQQFPYPDVIYKLYGTKKEEGLDRKLAKQLKKRKIKTLNYLFTFNKWDVLKHLSRHENLAPHLPHTIYYNTSDDLKNMLNLFPKVYLKHCQSGLGRGVICISKLPEGSYEFRYYINKLYVLIVNDFTRLIREVHKFYSNKEFIIQEAIDLIKIDNSIVDMRAELQKNGNGDIIISALPVRISNSNAPITTHANCMKFESFFKGYMNYSDEEIFKLKIRITHLLNIIYKCIEDCYGSSGELSIDLGLDKRGHLWFIENNCISSKVSFYKAYDKNSIHNSYLNLLEYAKFLYKT